MKSKVLTLRIAIIISVLSLLASIIIYFSNCESNILSFVFTITSGIFSGTIVSVFIYIAEYSTERRSSLENYYIISNSFLNNFLKIKYLEERDEYYILADYEKYIVFKDCKYLGDISDKYINAVKFYKLENVLEDKAASELDQKLIDLKNKVEIVIDKYLEFDIVKYGDNEFAYGLIYFFFRQKRKRELYKKIHSPQKDMLRKIKDTNFHFREYKNAKNGNLHVMLDYIFKLQSNIFSVESNEQNNYDIISNTFCEEIYEELEKFRAKIYGQEPIEREKFIVEAIYRNESALE